MASLKQWLNESPYATAMEREQPGQTEDKAIVAVFDPRTEVTADAKYIVKFLTWNLVLWFLVVPAVVGFVIWAVSR